MKSRNIIIKILLISSKSIFAYLFLVTSLLLTSFTSKSQQYILQDDDVIVENGVIQSCQYNFESKDIIMPDILDDQTIIGIRDVSNLEDGVFQAKGINSIQLPSTIEFIGKRAFKLNNLTLLDLSICPNIRIIGNGAFDKNNIITLNLDNCRQLTTIDQYAFNENFILALDFSTCSSLRRIGEQAFTENKIQTINFTNCENLEIISYYSFVFNELTELDLSDCINLKTIAYEAFLLNPNLTSIDLSGCISLIEIGWWAFSITSLTSVDLSSCTALATIGLGAFDDTDISSIVLPTPNYPGYVYWQDNNGNIFNAGDAVSTVNGYTAFDVFTPVTFTVTNNGVPVDSATVAFYDRQFFTNEAGMLILPNILQGTYTYTVSATGFENATGEITVGVNSVSVNIELWGVGVNEIAQLPIRIYPNPGNDHLNISLPAQFSEGRIEMYNTTGKVMIEKYINGKNGTVYTGHLPEGINLYRIYEKDTIIGSGKWVKE